MFCTLYTAGCSFMADYHWAFYDARKFESPDKEANSVHMKPCSSLIAVSLPSVTEKVSVGGSYHNQNNSETAQPSFAWFLFFTKLFFNHCFDILSLCCEKRQG